MAVHDRARGAEEHSAEAELHRRPRFEPRAAGGSEQSGGAVQLSGAYWIASTEPARPAAGQSGLEFRQRRGGQGGILEHALLASAARAALFERAGLSMVLYVHAL